MRRCQNESILAGIHCANVAVLVRWLDKKKVCMNVTGNAEKSEYTNVLSLFSSTQIEIPDPLQELLKEAQTEAWQEEEKSIIQAKRILATETQFPDQSIFTLEQQLANLTTSLGRLKFYLTDLDDLLPR